MPIVLCRFNRDVEDALSRIQEKYSSIPEDRGRDLKAAQAYLKKHEGFENELVALEAQVGLVDEAMWQYKKWYYILQCMIIFYIINVMTLV